MQLCNVKKKKVKIVAAIPAIPATVAANIRKIVEVNIRNKEDCDPLYGKCFLQIRNYFAARINEARRLGKPIFKKRSQIVK